MAGRAVLLLVFAIPASAQFDVPPSPANSHVRVHVADGSGTCDTSTKVELMQAATSVARGVTGKDCMVDFAGVPSGAYRLVISGRGYAGIETNEITLTSFDTEPIEVKIPRGQTTENAGSSSAATSVADLRIPKRAAKEFDKAKQEMDRQQWDAAADSLRRAIADYPQYAAAYNNLAVIYARVGDRGRESDALHQAITIDNRYVPAYVNLARMNIAQNKFADAEAALRDATSLDPTNGVILVLLSYAEFMNHHFDDAISDCKKVHALSNVPHAYAHWTAAFALEAKNQIAEAGAEFRTFVEEEPTGERAEQARKELVNIAKFLSPKDDSSQTQTELEPRK